MSVGPMISSSFFSKLPQSSIAGPPDAAFPGLSTSLPALVGTYRLAAFQQTLSIRLFAHPHTRITRLEVKGKRQVLASFADENGKQTKPLHMCNIP